MIFSSLGFIFIFLPVVWLGFTLLKSPRIGGQLTASHYTLAKWFLVASSLFFYAFWRASYLLVLLGSVGVNYLIARKILACQNSVKTAAAATQSINQSINQLSSLKIA